MRKLFTYLEIFFNIWLGDDVIEPWQMDIIWQLKAFSKNHKVFFIKGNRDFLIGDKFCELSGCNLLNDERIIIAQGFKLLLLHGDSLCTLDKKYMIYKKIITLNWLQKLFQFLPFKFKNKIATKIRNQSKSLKTKN